MLIDSRGKACLTDFGLSTVCGGLVQRAVYIGCPGAIRWAAPELIIGAGQHSTFESDIYSFGSIMLQVGFGSYDGCLKLMRAYKGALWRTSMVRSSGRAPYHQKTYRWEHSKTTPECL